LKELFKNEMSTIFKIHTEKESFKDIFIKDKSILIKNLWSSDDYIKLIVISLSIIFLAALILSNINQKIAVFLLISFITIISFIVFTKINSIKGIKKRIAFLKKNGIDRLSKFTQNKFNINYDNQVIIEASNSITEKYGEELKQLKNQEKEEFLINVYTKEVDIIKKRLNQLKINIENK